MVNVLAVTVSARDSHFYDRIFNLKKFATINFPCSCKKKKRKKEKKCMLLDCLYLCVYMCV